MKLKDLVKKLAAKPNQNKEVEFVVFERETPGNIVCCDLCGPATHDIMKLLAKHIGGKEWL